MAIFKTETNLRNIKMYNRTTPIGPTSQGFVLNKDLNSVVLENNTLVESTITYRPEDVIEKKGSTPFLHTFLITFPGIDNTLLTLLTNPDTNNVNRIVYTLSLVYDGYSFDLELVGNNTPISFFPSSLDFINTINDRFAILRLGAGGASVPVDIVTTTTYTLAYDEPSTRFLYGDPSNRAGNSVITLNNISFSIDWMGTRIESNFNNPSEIRMFPSTSVIEIIYSPLLNILTNLQNDDVYYKRLKVITRKLTPPVNNVYSTNNQAFLSEVNFNLGVNVMGNIRDKDTNAEKTLGISIEFAETNLVSRRQVAYTCFENSKEARSSVIAKNLADYLKNSHNYNAGVDIQCQPIYQRETRLLVPIGAFIEGLRDTAAKKRRFLQTVLQPRLSSP